VATSLKQQSAGRHVATLGHFISIPSKQVFVLTLEYCVLSKEAANSNLLVDLARIHDLPHSWIAH